MASDQSFPLAQQHDMDFAQVLKQNRSRVQIASGLKRSKKGVGRTRQESTYTTVHGGLVCRAEPWVGWDFRVSVRFERVHGCADL